MEHTIQLPKTSKRAALAKNFRQNWQLYAMVLLPVAWYIIFMYVPMYGLQIAFRDYMPSKGFLGSEWVGLKHFDRFFNSYYCGRVIRNTLSINFYSLLIGFPIPIIFALMLNELRSVRYKKIVQNVTYLPHFLSAVVIVSILQLLLSPTNGVINMVLARLGFETVDFLAKPEYFQHIYVWSGIWESMGWDAIMYIAALSGVDPGLYEAATIDGASRWQKIRHVSIPCIMGTIIIMLLLRCGSIMNIGYEKILLMQNSLNMDSSDVISTYVYRSGILGAEYSFGSAIGLFNSLCNFVLLVCANWAAKHFGKTSLF
ncbi:binding-protein-dependent transport systems inner membrane component [Clostridium sp. CAG:1013]|jgi:putative aldouronate transport system permease protein|nr:binding-protein-dependent transport systems inner membrane component [Clostridium sp. CAG:1013]